MMNGIDRQGMQRMEAEIHLAAGFGQWDQVETGLGKILTWGGKSPEEFARLVRSIFSDTTRVSFGESLENEPGGNKKVREKLLEKYPDCFPIQYGTFARIQALTVGLCYGIGQKDWTLFQAARPTITKKTVALAAAGAVALAGYVFSRTRSEG